MTMSTAVNRRLTLVFATALLVVAAAAGLSSARANGTACSAYIGGLETGKTVVPELVVFNTTGTPLSLTLTLRDPAGQTLTTPAGTIDVPGFNTALVSLGSKLATAAAGKPYIGRFSAQISGAPPFGETTSVVHVTQYYGKAGKNFTRPVKPASAFIVRALFVTGP